MVDTVLNSDVQTGATANPITTGNASEYKVEQMRIQLLNLVKASGLTGDALDKLISKINMDFTGSGPISEAVISDLFADLNSEIQSAVNDQRFVDGNAMINQIAVATEYQNDRDYIDLPYESRERIDEMSRLMQKSTWTAADKETVISDLSVSPDIAKTPFGKSVAHSVSKMPGVDQELQEIKKTAAPVLAKVQITLEKSNAQMNKAIASVKSPEKEHLEALKPMMSSTPENAAAMTEASKHPDQIPALTEKTLQSFSGKLRPYYKDVLAQLPDSQKDLLKPYNIDDVIRRSHDVSFTPERLKKAQAFLQHPDNNADGQTKLDAASLNATTIGATRINLDVVRDMCKELTKEQKLHQAVDPNLEKLFDPKTSVDQREAIFAQSLKTKYPSISDAQSKAIAHTTIKAADDKLGVDHLKDIGTATDRKLSLMNGKFFENSEKLLKDTLHSYDQKATDEVSNKIATGVAAKAVIKGYSATTAQTAQVEVENDLKAGAAAKKLGHDLYHSVTNISNVGLSGAYQSAKGALGDFFHADKQISASRAQSTQFIANEDKDITNVVGAVEAGKFAKMKTADGKSMLDLNGNAAHDVEAIKAALLKAGVNLEKFAENGHLNAGDLGRALDQLAVKTGANVAGDPPAQHSLPTKAKTLNAPAH